MASNSAGKGCFPKGAGQMNHAFDNLVELIRQKCRTLRLEFLHYCRV
jgi:hypothetical protein